MAEGNSLVNIHGGRFGDSVYAIDAGTVNLYGGTFDKAGDGATLLARDGGTINVFGSDFVLGAPGNAYRSLTGTLSDGSLLNVYVLNDSTVPGPVQVILHTIPEPPTICLVLAALGFDAARNARRWRLQSEIARGLRRGSAKWGPLSQEEIACALLSDDDLVLNHPPAWATGAA